MSLQFFNLVNGALMRSPLQPFTFPGGEAHIQIPEQAEPVGSFDTPPTPIALLRGADSHELMQLALWASMQHTSPVLLIPYLPAARADRGQPFGAHVYAEIINTMGFDKVVFLDPHSSVMVGAIRNAVIAPVARLIADSVDRVDLVGVIAPDAGATRRAHNAADALGLPLYQATKKRDFETGKLSSPKCEPLPEDGRLLVVDDICDGGGTFAALADATGIESARLDLWVTHGVFSGAYRTNLKHSYNTIYATDSHPGTTSIKNEPFKIVPALPTLLGATL